MNTLCFLNKQNLQKVKEICVNSLSCNALSAMENWLNLKKDVARTMQKIQRAEASDDKLAISHLSEVVRGYEEKFPLPEAEMDIYHRSQMELESLLRKRAEGIMFRSRAKWYGDGERSTKYFLGLERARYNSKTCNILMDEAGRTLRTDSEILEYGHNYYSQLYSKDEDVTYELTNRREIYITDGDRQRCSGPFEMHELKQAIKELQNQKTPGIDGLPAEFYKLCCPEIQTGLLQMIHESYEQAVMGGDINTGVLNLIPKPGKDARYIRNLRPITLLNADYKLIEKMIAKRIEPCLQYLIHGDQTGFMTNRRISTNIRKVYDLLQYCDTHQIDSFLLDLDFVKCFDKISMDCIVGALNYFQFPPYIVNWVTILYTNFYVKLQNNGHFSNYVHVQKSVHQGGCMSVQLFLLCAELVAIELRGCEKIKGIPVGDIVLLLNQFADDMDIASLFEQESLDYIMSTLSHFKRISGFTLSYEKTNLFRMGSLKHSDATLYTQKGIAWTSDEIKVLGVTVDHLCPVMNTTKNFAKVIDQSKATLNAWINRGLSLKGKVCVINTLVASLYVYKLMVLPSMPAEQWREINKLLEHFIWDGHKPKISLKKLQLDYKNGGLRLTDLKRREIAIKLTWPKILANDQTMSALVYSFFKQDIGKYIWECNLSPGDKSYAIDKEANVFWSELMGYWCEYNFVEVPSCPSNQILWLNSLIRSNNQPLWNKKAFKKGLIYVRQLYCDGKAIGWDAAKEHFGLSIMQYNQIVGAIPAAWRSELHNPYGFPQTSNYEQLLSQENASRKIYQQIMERGNVCLQKAQVWTEKLGMEVTASEMQAAFSAIHINTNSSKLRSFQYRMLHNALILNIHLKRWGMTSTDLCTFCNRYRETVKHVFMECSVAQSLWTFLEKGSLDAQWPSCEFEL